MKSHHPFNALLAFLLLSSVILSSAAPVSAQTTGDPARFTEWERDVRGDGPVEPAEVEAFLDGFMASEMSEKHVPGAVIVVVKDGGVFFSRGYGYADLEKRVPVDPQKTLFRLASVSKPFVWTSVMQLVEQERLSLDADVNEYLDFTIPATYSDPITLRMLMTHTAGFEDRGEALFMLKPEDLISLDAYLKKYLPARVFPPGEVGAYSNYGAALAGYIVQRVSGMPFDEYVEKNIFSPLGVTQATFRQPLPADLASDMSSGYNYVDGGYVRGGFEYVLPYPAASLSAAGLEIAKFMIAHLQNGRYGDAEILREDTDRLMHSQLYTADSRVTGMAYGFFENVVNDRDIISHQGNSFLFHSGLFLLPAENVGFFVSTNAVGGESLVDALVRAFVDHYFPMEKAADPIPAADFDSRAAKYVGEYYSSRNHFSGFEKVFMLTTPISVTVDENKNVILSGVGETRQFVEVEPAFLVNREHPDDTIVMKEENGQVVLYPSGPFVFFKTPWYGSLNLHLLILAGGALLFLITLVRWLLSFVSGMIKHESRPLVSRFARLIGGLFALAYLSFVLAFLALMSDINPAYGVPDIYFATAAEFKTLLDLPILIGIFGLLMLPFAVIAWIKRFWSLNARLSYTFLILVAFAILWSLTYWNLLL